MTNTNRIRNLSADEIDAVSGGYGFAVRAAWSVTMLFVAAIAGQVEARPITKTAVNAAIAAGGRPK